MRWRIVAVGHRLPDWAQRPIDDWTQRLPAEFALPVVAVKAESRQGGRTAAQCMAAERQRLEAAVPRGAQRIVLDERGRDLDTAMLAAQIGRWHDAGDEVAFLMGGADGLDPQLKAQAAQAWRLSSLTLPHALARVVLVEALYRAWSLHAGHPYHREGLV